jgi:hypothetical protein
MVFRARHRRKSPRLSPCVGDPLHVGLESGGESHKRLVRSSFEIRQSVWVLRVESVIKNQFSIQKDPIVRLPSILEASHRIGAVGEGSRIPLENRRVCRRKDGIGR